MNGKRKFEMSEHHTNQKIFKKPEFKNNNGLILYFHPCNFYSQKVLIVLHEKCIEFTSYIVDLANGEQYSSWFLNLNSKGDVPVLQDGCFIIPGSIQIINYLEVKYKNGLSKSLLPQNLSKTDLDKILQYQKIFNRVPIGAITLGSFIHDDLKLNSKPPFIGPFKRTFLESNVKVGEILKSSSHDTSNQSYMEILMRKVEFQNKRYEIVQNRNEFQKILDAVQAILEFVEKDLKQHNINSTIQNSTTKQEWLCGNEITLADISFGILLYRLYILGFENYFWKNDKLPFIENYLNKFKNLDSFKKSIPSQLSIIKELWLKAPSNFKIGAAGVMAIAMFAAFAHKNN